MVWTTTNALGATSELSHGKFEQAVRQVDKKKTSTHYVICKLNLLWRTCPFLPFVLIFKFASVCLGFISKKTIRKKINKEKRFILHRIFINFSN